MIKYIKNSWNKIIFLKNSIIKKKKKKNKKFNKEEKKTYIKDILANRKKFKEKIRKKLYIYTYICLWAGCNT